MSLDLLCFSYLATARVCHIDHYPDLNQGAHISQATMSVAGDGPIVAAAGAGLGLATGLVCNDVGQDSDGARVMDYLVRHGILHQSVPRVELNTPFAVILVDHQSNREWFSYIGDSFANTWRENWPFLLPARLMYVDVYADLLPHARIAVERAKVARTPLFLNIGQSILTDELTRLLVYARARVVQVSLNEDRDDDAYYYAQEVLAASKASSVVVTLGAKGAVYLSAREKQRSAAPVIQIQHTHGAGAVFSAAFCLGMLMGWPALRSLEYATAAGTLRCASSPSVESFTMEELDAFRGGQPSVD